MRRCHLQCTSTKSTINIPIAYDWNFPMDQRNNSFLAFKVSIPLIIGMNCNCCITKNGFRPGGGYSDPLIRGTGNLISYFVEYGFFFFIQYLLIGQYRLRGWIPIDHALATIELSLFVQIHKNLDDRI